MLDIVIQSLIVLWAMVSLGLGRQEMTISIAIAQACMGGWQMFSSIFWLMKRHPLYRHRWVHLMFSGAYLILLVTFAQMGVVSKLVFFLPSWLLAAYYFGITIKTAIGEKSNGTFLRHLSF